MARNEVDCYSAYEKRSETLSKLHGMTFREAKLKRKEVVTTMTTFSRLKVRDEVKAVNPLVLFKRMSIKKKK